ncbi:MULTISPECIES: VWA domain-containing protein [unclassified Fusibacter]|uniref:vWA domain-containing protein n=1 Tax=unclassified Fusibacter TaxID=2624464 RepID=UPI0013E8F674|nr:MULTISPECIES: vWA domain-containing protein [unclassified Fusibacter]MCK8060458.1 VWA domain-containing protein [Fusibacter sp. A2]NPE20253.1 VWA domain-containing protein [Fusibacter sp. A1]
MMHLRKIMALVLVIVLVINIVACKNTGSEEGTGDDTGREQKNEEVQDKTGLVEPDRSEGFSLRESQLEQVWLFEDTPRLEWSQTMPAINPMGSEDAYSHIGSEGTSYLEVDYLNSDFEVVSRTIYGDLFYLDIPFKDDLTDEQNRQFIDDLSYYIKSKKGTDYGIYEGQITFSIMDEFGDIWWATAHTSDEEHHLITVRENLLPVEERIVIDLENTESPFYFSYLGDESRMKKLSFDFNSNQFGVAMYVSVKAQNGEYLREYNKGYYFEDSLGDSYSVTDLPPETEIVQCQLDWDSSASAGELEIKLTDLLKRDGNLYGEDLGAIKVSASHVSSVSVKSSDESAYLLHPDYHVDDLKMDVTPDGDFMIYLPSGLWDVYLSPVNGEIISNYCVRGVSVSSGLVTLVDVPYGVSSAISASGEAIDARGIEMSKFVEDSMAVEYEFTLLDSTTASIEPEIANTNVYEGGVPVEIMDLRRVLTAPDIFLLIDSSGSMKGQLSGVLQSAKEFVKGLPEDSKVQVVDFDSTVKMISGTSVKDATVNIDKLTVGGDTALYEALKQSIEKLQGASRPIIVLFTDGENDLKELSLTLDEVLSLLPASNIPVYSIGYGENPDHTALKLIAKNSLGKYFSAADQSALIQVFDAIDERLSHTYKLSYKRPTAASIGDTPIVTFMIDTSGSMEEVDEGFGQRIHNMKELLKSYVLSLPDTYRVQIMGFDSSTYYVQSLTSDKVKLMMGIDSLTPGGPTNIPTAINGGILSLKDYPSTKKMMVFITDEALDSKDESLMEFVKELKDESVRTLWVGFGSDVDVEEDFEYVAGATEGSYVLTDDPDVLKASMDELFDKVKNLPDSKLSQVSMEIEKEDEYGNHETFGSFKLVQLSPLKTSGDASDIGVIKEQNIGRLSQYDKETAKLISGRSIPKDQTIVTGRMSVGKNKSSEAMEISAKDIYYLSRLDGLSPPSGYQFVAVDLSVENVFKEQLVTVYPDGSNHPSSYVSGPDPVEEVMMIPDYMIPDFKNHFFLEVNGLGTYPASSATYLTNASLPKPGDVSIRIEGAKTKEGILVFMIPEESVSTMSLHFYDVTYGHIHLPIIGKMVPSELEVESLSKVAGEHLSDTFSIQIAKVSDQPVIAEEGESIRGLTLREVTGSFTSNRQALLDINPSERVSLELETANGAYYVPVHPKTAMIPFGNYSQRMIAPGSENMAKWLFEIPSGLTDLKSNLFIELYGEDIRIMTKAPLSSGEPLSAVVSFEGDADQDGVADFRFNILSATITDGYNEDIGPDQLVFEVSIEDYEDGFSTGGIEEILTISGLNQYGDPSNAYLSYQSEELILALNEESVVYDGTHRRGILVYDLSGMVKESLSIGTIFADVLDMTIATGDVATYLCVKGTQPNRDESYSIELSERVLAKIQAHEATQLELEVEPSQAVTESSATEMLQVPVPSITLYGSMIIEKTKTESEMLMLLKGLRYVPSNRYLEPYTYLYSPEATLTQGFATEQDYAGLALMLLSKNGYQPKRKVVKLTEKGRAALDEFAGWERYVDELPAIQYVEDGVTKLLVLPFVEDIKALKGLCYLSKDQTIVEGSDTVSVTISIHAKSLIAGREDHLSDFSDALAGETDSEEAIERVEVFSESFELDSLSVDAIDIGFSDMGSGYRTLINKNGQIVEGTSRLLKREYEPVGIELRIGSDLKEHYKYIAIDKSRTLEHYFLTLGINQPDIHLQSITEWEAEANYRKSDAQAIPDDFTSIRWHTREILYKFIANQSAEEARLSDELAVIAGRTDRERVILISAKAPVDGAVMETSIDLLQTMNDLHSGETAQVHAFNLMSGLQQTFLESYALGSTGYGAFEIIGSVPTSTDMIVMPPYLNGIDTQEMTLAGVPEHVITHMTEENKYYLMPNRPSRIKGLDRWAWIEIDPSSYEAIGMIDTLEHGAMVERAITGTVKDAGQYFVGGFVGVSSSIWAVSAMSLIEDDYDKIIEDARKFVLGMKNNFGIKEGPFSISVGGKPQIGAKYGGLKASFNGKVGFGQTYMGFTEGFVDAVNAYFDGAK